MIEFQEEITNFIFVNDVPQPCDIIFIPGNGYPQMSEHAAKLYKEGYAPLVLPSGRFSITTEKFTGVLAKRDQYPGVFSTEWEFMKTVLTKNMVPSQAILREDLATFTYENAIFSRQVTDKAGLSINKAILCCKSYHARRCLMYYKLLYPHTKFYVCPSDIEGVTAKNWHQSQEGIDAVMGEVTRILKQFNLML